MVDFNRHLLDVVAAGGLVECVSHCFFSAAGVTSLPTAGLATGDTFISDTATRDRLAQQAQLCDMEGYCVVKVAREFGIPVTLIKQVSDHADESAAAKWHDAARGGVVPLGECVAQIVGLTDEYRRR
ncbi:5'-methylthioadenosine/S-adenosylhomocysteine nucleosidase [Corynebacterium diphtheriae]|nr:5'-methylthioadenosine/S-adenosylhomocysteine nucleosidase [Corynebacterium diphtheriae]CAB0712830.1 5'-methylthioadenosine/S-adenosylhomocysteine nucleosidase [Corynebacterium diphtheriae]CAB0739406.1 5'-methylthioadenosine/S-adenosylhomocysteine nucleosidase [Corynebacterium diphtheriae]CAB0760954.1 5'-methylthioadenosine/S-adenosylhomocysteine nucleosidase [Corynebacterium diphtheriae]CAB0760955.1 5'-methylthioadenosine/S-adenosylhomocysteine nucleosidase [Corynebacterium diphtheriae]